MSSGQGSSPAAEGVQQRMDVLMTKYLSLKAALLVPSTLDNSLIFCATSGSWMTQIAMHKSDSPLSEAKGWVRLVILQHKSFDRKSARAVHEVYKLVFFLGL